MNLKNKIAYYSQVLVGYLFWGYFLFYVFFYKKLPIEFKYILILLLGLYIGYRFAMWSIKTLKK